MGADTFKHGTYIGPQASLLGETALLRTGPDGTLLVQFDNMNATYGGRLLGFDWHTFKASDFKVDKVEEGADD